MVSPAEAIDITAQVTAAVEEVRAEQRKEIEAAAMKLLDGKDQEIRRLEQELKAKEIPPPMFPKKTPPKHPVAPAPKESLTESKHAPKVEATGQMEMDEVEEDSPESRDDSPVSEADKLEFVAAEWRPLINAPTAPHRMRVNGPPLPVPPRPA